MPQELIFTFPPRSGTFLTWCLYRLKLPTRLYEAYIASFWLLAPAAIKVEIICSIYTESYMCIKMINILKLVCWIFHEFSSFIFLQIRPCRARKATSYVETISSDYTERAKCKLFAFIERGSSTSPQWCILRHLARSVLSMRKWRRYRSL